MYQDTPCICIPFFSNNNFHSSESEVVGLYLYFTDGTTELVNFTHPDSRISEKTLESIKFHPNSLVLNKKGMLYHGFDSGIDLNSYLHYYIHDHANIQEFYTSDGEFLLSILHFKEVDQDNSTIKVDWVCREYHSFYSPIL